MLRFLTAGESHGPAEVAILEGIPAGLTLSVKHIQLELEKRRGGAGRGGRGKIETDKVEILSGVRFGKTIGSPIALLVKNNDFINWQTKMSQDDIEESEKQKIKITNPRPGHADLPGVQKYGFDDIRNVLERASARETVMRVAVGAVAKRLLLEFGIKISSHTLQIGKVKLEEKDYSFYQVEKSFENDPELRCIDANTAQKMKNAILTAIKNRDSLGGIVEIIAHNVPPGLGSYAHWDRRLDGKITQILMSIPSVKAIEIGNGIDIASEYGSMTHDEIFFEKGKYMRKSNRAGGIEGGISNGEDIVCRVYHKPISTLGNPLKTVDIATKEKTVATIERSDVCIVPRAGVIAEACIALVLADSFLEKFGADSLRDVKYSFERYNK
ncbi:chorismate synthase [Patescibacteria group bacterium]|nr:chorismate synthase [Patescibacteria group bacterium]MCL5797459.1 chorismate synthase [Patescibacteria group bacterium]